MIPLGNVLKAWAISISGYGTIIETDEKQAQKEATHFEGRGRSVDITEMVAVTAMAPKPKLLMWNELTHGEYWGYPVSDCDGLPNQGTQRVSIQDLGDGRFLIDADYESGYLDKSWARFQYLPRECPRREDVVFQPVSEMRNDG
jgi:hypothetical protein